MDCLHFPVAVKLVLLLGVAVCRTPPKNLEGIVMGLSRNSNTCQVLLRICIKSKGDINKGS